MQNHLKSHKINCYPAKSYMHDTQGNIAIIFAFLMPFAMGGLLFAHDLNVKTTETEFARTVAQTACNRVVKSSITNYPTLEAKEKAGEVTLEAAYVDRKNIKNVSYDIDLKEYVAEVTVTATINTLLNMSSLSTGNIKTSVDCAGIPPYPRVDEVVYEGNFGLSITDETPYTFQAGNQCWGRIDAEKIGWNFTSTLTSSASTKNCGLEVQDWSNPSKCGYFIPRNAEDNTHNLPNTSSDGIVIELDGNCNTAINKPLELHPGTYEFSIWYRGRSKFTRANQLNTNDIGMYLQRADQTTLEPLETLAAKHKIISMSDPNSQSWKNYAYTFQVPDYGIYLVTMMGEGRNDSLGGLFTSFELTYKELSNDRSGGTVGAPIDDQN